MDEIVGWQRLKVAIHYLRQRLADPSMPKSVVETDGQCYRLRRESVWVDSDAFERLVKQAMALLRLNKRAEAESLFEDAKSLYLGDFLDDEIYADWCAAERSRLSELYLEALAGCRCRSKSAPQAGVKLVHVV